MAPPNSPDMPPKLTEKVRLGIKINLHHITPVGREGFRKLAKQLNIRIDDHRTARILTFTVVQY